MEIKDCFQLGKITKPFGYKGEVVFFLDVDEPMDYAEMDSVFIEIGGKLLPYFCLKNPVDRGSWQLTVHGVIKESYRT